MDLHRAGASFGVCWPLTRLCENSHRNHMIRAPAGAIMTAPGGVRDPFQSIPANLPRTTGSYRWPRLLHILFGAAFAEVATWQTQQWPPGRCTSLPRDVSYRARRALLFSYYLQHHARLVSLAAPFHFPRIRRGLRCCSGDDRSSCTRIERFSPPSITQAVFSRRRRLRPRYLQCHLMGDVTAACKGIEPECASNQRSALSRQPK